MFDHPSVPEDHDNCRTSEVGVFREFIPPSIVMVLVFSYWVTYPLTKGSGAFSGKIFHVRIVENNKIDTYFRAG